MKHLLILFSLFTIAGLGSIQAQLIEAGSWHGKVEFPGQSLRLILHLEQTQDGWAASLDSPDQNGAGMVADEVTVSGDTLLFSIERLGVSYEGLATTTEGIVSIDGIFSQAGFNIPLSLGKAEIEGPKRPQTPVAPFPYTEEEVSFLSPNPNVTLFGTLTIPEGDGPFPAVILVTGSGPQDRDETIAGHRPFHVIADVLSRQGIAVLRYDERGIGESEGEFSTATSADFADDAEAALNFLASVDNIIAENTGIIGHSEGALIAPMVASRRPETGFIIMLAGPSIPGREVLNGQSALILGKMGIPGNTVDKMLPLRQNVHEILRANPSDSVFTAKLQQQADTLLSAFNSTEKQMLGLNEENLVEQFSIMATPWFRYFLEYDPYPALQATTCPILALNGDLDVQVLADPNLTKLEALFEQSGHPSSKAVLLEGLNHLFQPAETGLPLEYPSIEITFDPATLELIVGWIKGLE